MKRFAPRFIFLLIAIICMLVLYGCGQEKTQVKAAENDRVVVDSTGARLSIVAKPQRVVSLSISTDEIILDLLPPERIAGVSSLADQPSISNSVEKAKLVPDRVYAASPESLIKLQPDLVIAPDFVKEEAIATLRDLGMMVYVYKTQKDIADVRKVIQDIGVLVGEEKRANQLVADLDARLAAVQERVKGISKPKRVILLHREGAYYMPKTSFHDVCRHANAVDATLDLRYDKAGPVSKEQVVILNPDVFVIIDFNYDGRHDVQVIKDEILNDKSYGDTNAVRNNEVYVLPGKHMLGLSHHIADAVEDLAHVLYPECFKE